MGVEGLEERKVFTAGVSLIQNMVYVHASDSPWGDAVQFEIDPKTPNNPLDDAVKVTWSPGHVGQQVYEFPAWKVSNLTFVGGNGDDHARNYTTFPSEMYGGLGDDVLEGGNGRDHLYGNEGDDYLGGYGGDDVLWGQEGSDTIHGDGGDDMIYGYTDSTHIMNEPASDASSVDHLYGDANNDKLLGNNLGVNFIYGNGGNDTLVGGTSAMNYLYGNDGNDSLFGEGYRNYLFGGAGSDYIGVSYYTSSTNYVDSGDDSDIDFLSLPDSDDNFTVHFYTVYNRAFDLAAWHRDTPVF